MQATIQVKYVNAPKPGKKMANVKDASGATYFYYPDKMAFQEGETANIEYDAQTWGDKPANVIRHKLPAQAAPVVVPSNFQPPPGHNSNGHSNGHDKDRLIFVTGVVGRAMGSGQYGANDIGLLTKAAAVAFAETFGDAS